MGKTHRFTVGQIVHVAARRFEGVFPTGSFEVLEQLPEVNGERQYKIKSRLEPFERMVGEGRLSSS
ncbi:MAG TPA: hypothetical protein HPQ04_08420 [Rhodospirillaceae bacterium]|nr:hypothetical protein [Rhodospirillaceae bacterium]